MKLNNAQLKAYHQITDDLLEFLASFPKKEFMQDTADCEVYLKRTQWFLDLLGNPEKQIPHLVHVTGTSGKGSTVRMIHEILHAGGKHVGSTYSPHPTTFIERIRVGESFIPVPDFIDTIRHVRDVLKSNTVKMPHGMISFFEFMFCAAMYYFAKKNVTHAVIEVGLGGRFDASNVIPTPDVTVITNIGLDHTHILGDTIEQIAWEKAGIIKSGTTFLSAERSEVAHAQFAKQLNAHPPKTQKYVPKPEMVTLSLEGTTFTHAGKQYTLGIIGRHQAQNAVLAIEAAHALHIPHAAIVQGLANTTRPSCIEIVQQNPLVIIDGAHNTDKIQSTVDALEAILAQQDTKPTVRCVFALTDTKDYKTILAQLTPLVDKFYFTPYDVTGFRTPTDPAVLATYANSQEIPAQSFINSMDALTVALHASADEDIVLVTGSIMLVGETRQHWIPEAVILEQNTGDV